MHPIPGGAWLEHHFPIYSYHMALFLFASGYLFRDIEWKDFGRYVWRKTRTLAIPLIAWNVVYACIVSLVNLRHPANYLPPTIQIWNLHNLLVEPFIGGHQYLLNLATWFVGMLYLTLLVFGLIHLINKRVPEWLLLLVYLACAILSLYSATLDLSARNWLVLQRIAYALFFVQLGRCFRIYIPPYLNTKYIWGLIGVVLIIWYCAMLGGDKLYVLAFMNFEGAIVRPIAGGILGCLFWMLVSLQLARIIPSNKLETLISISTWSIMTNHLLVRFMICWTFVHFAQDPALREAFANDFWFFPRSTELMSWYTCLYVLSAVLIIALPTMWQVMWSKYRINNNGTDLVTCHLETSLEPKAIVQNNSSRLTWLDIMKTIGMWTIICYHFFAPITAQHLSVVGVPLFFIISGYLAKIEDSWGGFLRKLYHSLFIPYLLLCIIRLCINLLVVPSWQPLDKVWITIFCWFSGFNKWHNIPGCNELWFVYVLILIKIIFQISQTRWKRLFCIFVLALLFTYYAPKYIVFPQDTFWGVMGLGLGLIFYLIGYLFRRFHQVIIEKEQWWKILLLSVVSGVLFWKCGDWNGYTGIGIGYYGRSISLCVIGGASGTLLVYGISRGLDALLGWFKGFTSYIHYHAIGSVVVLAWHIPLLLICQRYPLFPNAEVNACVYTTLIQIVFTPLLWLIGSYMPILVGKRK